MLHTIIRMLWIRPDDMPGERALSAIALVFLINGTILGSWVWRIPGISTKHGLSKGSSARC